MLHSLLAKFHSCADSRTMLLETGSRVLAEASPRDCKWGIGLSKTKASAGLPWRGKNLLGETLYQVRRLIKKSLAKPVQGYDDDTEEFVQSFYTPDLGASVVADATVSEPSPAVVSVAADMTEVDPSVPSAPLAYVEAASGYHD